MSSKRMQPGRGQIDDRKTRVKTTYGQGKHPLFLLSLRLCVGERKWHKKTSQVVYKPHKESKAPVFDVVRGKGTCTTVNQLKKWDTTASTLYWI